MKGQRSRRRRRQVNQTKISFTNKPITAWGGLAAIMGKFLEEIDFKPWVETNLPIQETSNNGKGVYEKVLATFLTVLAGGERFSHLEWWASGIDALKPAFDVAWLPKAASTVTRFWNKVTKQSLSEKFLIVYRRLASDILNWEGLREDNLNFDSTVLIRYGNQEGAKPGYNPKKKGRPSHHPLLAFLGAGYVINFWNRSGNTSAGQGIKDFLAQTLEVLGEGFRVKRVLCDSGFYLIELIEFLEEKSLCYIIAVPISQAIQRKIQTIYHWSKVAPGIELAEFYYQHKDPKWKKPRRYVVVRQEVSKRPKALGKQPSLFKDLDEWKGYRFNVMITNDHISPPEVIWREHRPRANDENVIKDLKEGYGLEAFNLKNFWATEAVLGMIGLVFHNLIHYLNRNLLNTNRRKEHLKTLRFKYFAIAAMLGSDGGYPILRLGVKGRKAKAKLNSILTRIPFISYKLNCNAFAPPEGAQGRT